MPGKAVIRRDLARAVSEEVWMSREASAELVDEVLDLITDALVNGEQVKIANFGTFTIRSKGERMGRNPKTGEAALIPARKVVRFKASEKLRHMVSHPEDLLRRPKAQMDLFNN